MSVKLMWRALISLVVLLSLVAFQNLSTAENLFHEISGVVKHVDKDAKPWWLKPLMGLSIQSNVSFRQPCMTCRSQPDKFDSRPAGD